MIQKNRNFKGEKKRPQRKWGEEVGVLQRCKTCGREYNIMQTMTYSAYGYCSWDCLMKKKSHQGSAHKLNRRTNGLRSASWNRSK